MTTISKEEETGAGIKFYVEVGVRDKTAQSHSHLIRLNLSPVNSNKNGSKVSLSAQQKRDR